ncbi:ATP phosphoribosyltransferase regulatory subunit [Geochorda subterranea]|uniref:ATP phosphoribosyltransferase regulatory subunit n=1 Tax=Geochorda subterranea TaxID=3109564 RepID=A0ABZ1BRG9_9FIRM|nr:ATP phosphoribosyltransferase regulatory subunit [Limnochorda sp. LNt]WRP15400.1 ATP phosphoribosyltransferase regulatory subunit [Limnochorda sp. LNt]
MTDLPPLQPPPGTLDLLPDAASARRRLEARLRARFERWGYREVVTPTLELEEVVRRAGGQLPARQLYRFVDREGQVVVLRPDWTASVARLIAGRLRTAPLPLRLFYIGSVFRYDRLRPDDPREFGQAGVELVGASSEMADAEVMALAWESCREAGIEGPHLEVGHAGYVQALLDQLPATLRADVQQALVRRDFVTFEALLGRSDVPDRVARLLAGLVEARGDARVVRRALDECPVESARAALASLERLIGHLASLGLGPHLAVDLGMVKDLDYYTGAIFEVYAPGGGASLATGGRYDTLMARFGLPLQATGFALSLERLTRARQRRGLPDGQPRLDAWVVAGDARADEDGGAGAVWQLLRRLREAGLVAALDPLARPLEESVEAARQQGAAWVVLADARHRADRLRVRRVDDQGDHPWQETDAGRLVELLRSMRAPAGPSPADGEDGTTGRPRAHRPRH